MSNELDKLAEAFKREEPILPREEARRDVIAAAMERFDEENHDATTLTISSFGFARGMPPLADLVFDMRFLDNPHWVDALRELTGQDATVGDYIQKDPAFSAVIMQIMLPHAHLSLAKGHCWFCGCA